MKRNILLFFTLFFFANQVSAQKQLVLDENAEPVSVSGAFNAIEVTDGLDVYISQSDNISMAASTGKKGCGQSIKAEIKDSVLHLSFQSIPGCKFSRSEANAYLSFKELNYIRVSNGSEVTGIGKIEGESLRIQVSSGSDFKGSVEVENLTLNLTGGSDIKISGKAKQVDIENSGASDVKGYGLTAENCNAKASGASDISITVTHLFKASASGASDIYYKGSATLEKLHSSGASTIKKQD